MLLLGFTHDADSAIVHSKVQVLIVKDIRGNWREARTFGDDDMTPRLIYLWLGAVPALRVHLKS